MNCSVGVYLNTANDTLSLSSNTGCNLVTPIYQQSGSYSGNIPTDCGVVSVARVNDPSQDTASGDSNKNAQSECSFVIVNTNRIVAAFFDTHLSEWGLGLIDYAFTNIASPRSAGWAVSTNGGASFTDNGALPPTSPANWTQGDAGDPVMARDTVNGTIYLLTNPSRETGWPGFRLWRSSDDGQNFTLVNTNVPGGKTVTDKPAIAVNNFSGLSNSTNLYVAGTAGSTIFVARSSNAGATWTDIASLGDGHGADIAIRPDGTVYVFYLAARYASDVYTNWFRYHWRTIANTNWQGPATFGAHPGRTNLYSLKQYGSGNLKRSNSATEDDFFISNGFPRVAVNPVDGHLYVTYADLSADGATTDRGDIYVHEGIPDGNGTITNWSGAIRVNNDRTATDQWNPSIAVSPGGTQLFLGFYSRQGDPSNNAMIRPYGAKAAIPGGVVGATFDVFPVSNAAFTNLFVGTTNSTPITKPWLFDPVWSPVDVELDVSARVVETNGVYTTKPTYANFTADDYTCAWADANYFYFAWRDCSDICTNSWKGTNYTRADPNIRLGRIKP